LKSKEYRNYFAPIAVHITDAQGNSPLKPEESENVKALIEQAAELIPAAVRSIDRFFKQTRPFFGWNQSRPQRSLLLRLG
jgi:hypothetical protein